MVKARRIAAGLVAVGLSALAAPAIARPFCSDPPSIPLFPLTGSRGSAVYETTNHVEPGTLACFKVQVPAARTLHVTLASIGNNAHLRIYPPGWTIVRDGNDFTFGEQAAPGAAEGDEARSWSGPLQQTGNTLIVIDRKNGGGLYRLHVEAQ